MWGMRHETSQVFFHYWRYGMWQMCGNCHRFFYVKELHPLISMSKIWAQRSKSRPRQLAMKELLRKTACFSSSLPWKQCILYIISCYICKTTADINSCCKKKLPSTHFLPFGPWPQVYWQLLGLATDRSDKAWHMCLSPEEIDGKSMGWPQVGRDGIL